ncbi:MucBP domain-containing protein [Miniphocaeibacter massiliensis]|uniref:MucBP domain-containing protein n=1 Tax=Miniphocaeibacter massiliensis TaxID=2041841 RepID=UPI000C1C3E56|nr:MucBP domain-containing protein [Miniphocaeibacter massiliensis]
MKKSKKLRKEGKVIIYGKDENGKIIYTGNTLTGKVGENYTTTAPQINGYKLDESKLPENSAGTFLDGTIEVFYYYTPESGINDQIITIRIINEETGEVIATPEVYYITPGEYFNHPIEVDKPYAIMDIKFDVDNPDGYFLDYDSDYVPGERTGRVFGAGIPNVKIVVNVKVL